MTRLLTMVAIVSMLIVLVALVIMVIVGRGCNTTGKKASRQQACPIHVNH